MITLVGPEGIIRISRQIRIINALRLRHCRQLIDALLDLAAPERVLGWIEPGEVEEERQRGFSVRVGGIGGFLPVGFDKGLDVVADEDAGAGDGELAVELALFPDGVDEGEGVAGGAEGVESAALAGRALVGGRLDEG